MKEKTAVVFCHNGLGDVIMSMPALDLLDASDDFGHLVFFVKSSLERSFLELFWWRKRVSIYVLSIGKVRKIKHFMKCRSLGVEYIYFLHGGLRKRWTYRIIMFLLSPKAATGAFVPSMLGVKVTNYSHYNQTAEHKVEYYKKIVAGSEIELTAYCPSKITCLDVSKPCIDIQNKLSDKVVVALGPGSGVVEMHKRWPPEYYSELMSLLIEVYGHDRIHFILFGSSEEKTLLYDISRNSEICSLAVGFELKDVVALLHHCDLIVCGDSGIAHLASVADIPIVLMCQPTNPSLTGPASDKLWIIRKPFRCSPCYREGFERGCSQSDCMKYIKPQEVTSAVISIINGEDRPVILSIKNKNVLGRDLSWE